MDNNVPNIVKEEDRIKTVKDAEPEILSYKDVRLDFSEKPKNTKKVVEVILLLIVISLFALASILYEKNNKNVLRKGISSIFNIVEDPLFELKGNELFQYSVKKDFKTSIITSFQTTFDKKLIEEDELKFLQEIKDVTISSTLDFSFPSKKAAYSIKSTTDGSNIFEINGNITDKDITYKIKNVIGKYILVSQDGLGHIFISKEEDKRDFDVIKNIVFKKIYKNIKETDLKRNKTVLTEINTKVTDVSYTITNAYLKALISNTITDLVNDDTFIEKTSDYTNLTRTRLKEKLLELKENISKEDILKDDITLNIYVKGLKHKFVGFKLSTQNDSIYYISTKNKKVVKISSNNEEIINYNDEKKSSTESTINIKYKGININIDKLIKNTSILYDYKIKSTNTYEGSLVLTKEEKTSTDGNIRFIISKIKDDENVWNLSSSISYNVKSSNGITPFEDEDAVKINKETFDEVVKRTLNNENLKRISEAYKSFIKIQN